MGTKELLLGDLKELYFCETYYQTAKVLRVSFFAGHLIGVLMVIPG